MLSTETPEFALYGALLFSVFAVIVGFAAIIIARSAASYARAVEKYLSAREPESRIAELSAEMTELSDAYAALLASHKKLRSRIVMRENREKGRDTSTGSDLSSETDKSKLRLAAKQAGLLK